MRIYTHTFRWLHLKIRDQKRQTFQWRSHKTHTKASHVPWIYGLKFIFISIQVCREGREKTTSLLLWQTFHKTETVRGLWQSSRAWSAAQGNIIGFTVSDFITRPGYPDLEDMISLVTDWTQLEVEKNQILKQNKTKKPKNLLMENRAIYLQ